MIRRKAKAPLPEPRDDRTDDVLNRLETVVERLEALVAQRTDETPK